MMEKELTPTESLKLIETMIGQAQRSFVRLGFYFVLWGTLLITILLFSYFARSNYHLREWEDVVGISALSTGAVISLLFGLRESGRTHATNPLSRAVGWLWFAFLITAITMYSGIASDPQTSVNFFLLAGLPTFTTGIMLRFKPLVLGSIVFWSAGVLPYFTNDIALILSVGCLAIVLGLVIPGYLLKRKEDGLRTT